MLRAEKARVIDDLNAVLQSSGVVVVTHYKGLTVAEINDLRRQVRAAGASFKVSKNRLARLALGDTAFGPIGELLKGPTAIAVSRDPTTAPKVIADYAKRNDKLKIIGGGLAGSLLDPDAVRALAELPSLDSLRAKIVGLLNAPASRLVGLLQAPGGQLARVLKAHADAHADAHAEKEPAGEAGA